MRVTNSDSLPSCEIITTSCTQYPCEHHKYDVSAAMKINPLECKEHIKTNTYTLSSLPYVEKYPQDFQHRLKVIKHI